MLLQVFQGDTGTVDKKINRGIRQVGNFPVDQKAYITVLSLNVLQTDDILDNRVAAVGNIYMVINSRFQFKLDSPVLKFSRAVNISYFQNIRRGGYIRAAYFNIKTQGTLFKVNLRVVYNIVAPGVEGDCAGYVQVYRFKFPSQFTADGQDRFFFL